MIVYPVVYTRTQKCDYFANFHVCPDFVDPSCVLPYIKSATTDINPAQNIIKKIIVADGECCVFGVIGYIKDICGNVFENFSRDEKGRAVYGFYGFAVQVDENSRTIPIFTEKDISEIYKRYIFPVWNDNAQHTQRAFSVMLSENNIISSCRESDFVWNESVNIYTSDDTLFETLLLNAITGDLITYCSSITDYKALTKSSFNYVVTSQNNVFRLRKEAEKAAEYAATEEQENTVYGNPINYYNGDYENTNDDTVNYDSMKEDVEITLSKYLLPSIAVAAAAAATVAVVRAVMKSKRDEEC